jgi:acyl-coenzyme A thioesterase PaaI-like protein
LEELTRSVRRLVEATVATGVDADALRAVARDVDAATAHLAEELDADPWQARSYGPGFLADPQRTMGINPGFGRCNPLAPEVNLEIHEDASVTGTVQFALQHVGPPNRAHGGMIASVFDQILGVAAIAGGSPGYTTSMTVRYRRATPLNRDVRFEAHFEGAEGRASRATAKMFDDDGTVTAEAEAVMVGVRGETETDG